MIPGPYRNLALIGFMGAGKSSTGRLLAERLGWDFVDADAAIEAAAGRPIARVLEEVGVAAR
jgi:shikimate kinase